ncbi:MAG: porin [Myxococcota bacterium]
MTAFFTLALSLAQAADDEAARSPTLSPYAAFVGGGAVEFVDRRQDDIDDRQGRFWTPALARIGLLGRLSDEWSINSEVEFNAGPYGTSVWEGQAAIQVRNQFIRYQNTDVLGKGDQVVLEVGRVTDPASLNYFSFSVANLLLSDLLTREPLLISGFNRGNGVRVEYTIADKLTAGFTLNAGNPTSTTATLAVGGTFPPFSRFYQIPWSNVGRDARGFPTSSFNTIVATPSLRLNTDVVDAQVAVQLFSVNTNTSLTTDDNLTGRNLRAGIRLKAPENRFQLFGNVSQMFNDVVELTDLAVVSEEEAYLGSVVSGGFDVRVGKRNLIGAQYDWVREEERGVAARHNHFVNAGIVIGLSDHVAMSGRFALWQVCQEQELLENCDVNGLRQGFLTLSALLGAGQLAQP